MSILQKGKRCILPWDAIAFFALYIILPSYCAIEFSEKLPLLTASRILLLLMTFMVFVRRRELLPGKNFSFKKMNLLLTNNLLLRWCLGIYFVLLLTANLVHIFETSESIKSIFTLLAEEYLLVWVVTMVVDTRQRLLSALRTIVISGAVVALIVTVGCLFNTNPFYYLSFTSRDMLMAQFYRSGMLRAEAGFGHPVYYGAYCAVILPLNLYFVEESKGAKNTLLFTTCFALNTVGLMLSNSRGSLIAFVGTMMILLVIKLILGFSKQLLVRYTGVIAATVACMVLVSALSPVGIAFLDKVIDSVTGSIIPQQGTHSGAVDSGEGELDIEIPGTAEDDFGLNPNGLRSRTVQLNGIRWTMMHEPIFGFGANAHVRGLVRFQFVEGVWTVTSTFDMDLVAIVCQYGIVGLIGWIFLYGAIVLVLLRKKIWKDKLNLAFGFTFISYFICMLSVTSQQKLFWVLLALLICHVRLLPTKEITTE